MARQLTTEVEFIDALNPDRHDQKTRELRQPFFDLAATIVRCTDPGPERRKALAHLTYSLEAFLEAYDATIEFGEDDDGDEE